MEAQAEQETILVRDGIPADAASHPAMRATLRTALLCIAALLVSSLAAVPARPADAAPTQLDITRFHGQVVIVDFWASWCKPCRQSIPWLNQLRNRYGSQGLVIIGVNVDAERADAERFLREVPVEFDVVYDPQGELAQRFHVQGMPSTLVYDRDGQLAHTLLGYREARRAEHEASIQALLSRKTTS